MYVCNFFFHRITEVCVVSLYFFYFGCSLFLKKLSIKESWLVGFEIESVLGYKLKPKSKKYKDITL